MARRRFNSTRLYKLTKIIVIGISVLCGLYAIWAYSEVFTNKMLHSWREYCRLNPDPSSAVGTGYSCISVGLDQIGSITDLMYTTGMIAIFLPILFFGGTWLYRYLFPIKKPF